MRLSLGSAFIQGVVKLCLEFGPDLATYGKVVAGGMPIGILAGTSRFMDARDGGSWQYGDGSFPAVGVTFFAGTFVRHPLALAACKAVLQHFKEQGSVLQERLNERTTRLVKRLNEFLQERGVPTRIEQFGSIFYLGLPSTDRCASLFYYCMADKGIHIREGFPSFLQLHTLGRTSSGLLKHLKQASSRCKRRSSFPILLTRRYPPTGTALSCRRPVTYRGARKLLNRNARSSLLRGSGMKPLVLSMIFQSASSRTT